MIVGTRARFVSTFFLKMANKVTKTLRHLSKIEELLGVRNLMVEPETSRKRRMNESNVGKDTAKGKVENYSTKKPR